MKKALFLSPVLTLLIVVSPVSADTNTLPNPGTLPGSPLYFLDRLAEEIGAFLTVNKAARVERRAAIAEERLAEANALSEGGKSEKADRAFQEYEDDMAEAVTDAKKAKDEGEDAVKLDEVLAKLAEISVRHQAALAEVYAKVPESAKDAIERAMEMSAKGHARAIQAISKEKRDEVRAQVEEEVEEALGHLEELRAEGIPVPHLDDVDDEVEDLDIEDELEGIDDEIRSAGMDAEEAGRPEDVPRR